VADPAPLQICNAGKADREVQIPALNIFQVCFVTFYFDWNAAEIFWAPCIFNGELSTWFRQGMGPWAPHAIFGKGRGQIWSSSTGSIRGLSNYAVGRQLWMITNTTRLRFNYDSTDVRLTFDCHSTALRPFDDLRYDLRPSCCGLLNIIIIIGGGRSQSANWPLA